MLDSINNTDVSNTNYIFSKVLPKCVNSVGLHKYPMKKDKEKGSISRKVALLLWANPGIQFEFYTKLLLIFLFVIG